MCCESGQKQKEKKWQNVKYLVRVAIIKWISHLTRCDDSSSSPGPRASACVPVKCWVPERERIRGWGGDAVGCCRVGVSECAGESRRCCGPALGRRRSGRGGLPHAVTPAPGYSVGVGEQQACMFNMCVCTSNCYYVFLVPLTVHGLTVRALLMKWNCSMPACREDWGGSTISTSCCSSCLLLSCLLGSTHRW